MAEELTIPTWRQALSERSHALYEAAWVIFKMHSVEFAADYLNDRKDEVIPLLREILESDDLYLNDSFGGGHAPVNVIRLIGHWELNDFLPDLLEVLADTPEQRPAYNAALNAVVNMGDAVIEPILAWVEEDATLRSEAAKVLRRVGEGNEEVFKILQSWIDINDPQMMHTYTTYLMDLDPKKAEMIIYDLSKNRDLDKEDRNRLKSKVDEARRRQQAANAMSISLGQDALDASEILQAAGMTSSTAEEVTVSETDTVTDTDDATDTSDAETSDAEASADTDAEDTE